MRKAISVFIVLLTLSVSLSAQETSIIKWYTLEEALALNEKQPKKIFIDVYTSWCGWCKVMDEKTFSNPYIAKYLSENFYPVKFNAEYKKTIEVFGRKFSNENISHKRGKNSLHEFTEFMNVNAVPTTALLDETGRPITMLQGELTAKELEPYLVFISNDLHKKFKSQGEWEDYQKKFKSKIKE